MTTTEAVALLRIFRETCAKRADSTSGPEAEAFRDLRDALDVALSYFSEVPDMPEADA